MTLKMGIDAGAATTKAVLLENDNILSYVILPTGHNILETAEHVTNEVLSKAARSRNELNYVMATGYGRNAITFANETVSEVICHAKGAHRMMPGVRTVIDIGGQDSKVIGINERGDVVDFVMNDKCAAGTGRFLEVIAQVLNLTVDQMGTASLKSSEPLQISNTCTIFAESEVVSLRAEGKSREDIIAGLHKAMAKRVITMAMAVQIHFIKDIVFTGGVAKNIGFKRTLEDEIGFEILVPQEPQIMGALGAAIFSNGK